MMKEKMTKMSNEHVHQFVFQDVEDCGGDEIHKVYKCYCGQESVDVYIRITNRWGKDKH